MPRLSQRDVLRTSRPSLTRSEKDRHLSARSWACWRTASNWRGRDVLPDNRFITAHTQRPLSKTIQSRSDGHLSTNNSDPVSVGIHSFIERVAT